jgi:hypothetical protein
MVRIRWALLWAAWFSLGTAMAACKTPVYDDDSADDDTGDDDTGDDDDDDDDSADDDTGDDDTGYVDADGDGWIAELDCDDGDPDSHPDAFDWCGDDVDQDCSGTADDAAVSLAPPDVVAEPFTYAAPVAADFSGDGAMDLAVVSYQLELHVLEGDGFGGIASSYQVGAVGNATGVVGGDFDGDADPDLAASQMSGCPLLAFANNGAGSFGSPQSISCTGSPTWGTALDADGDGLADLVMVDALAGTLNVLLAAGGLAFTPLAPAATSITPYEASAADLDGDGRPDLVVSGLEGGVVALTGNGDGTFTEVAALSSMGSDVEVGRAADLDLDGLDDLVAVMADDTLVIARSLGEGQFDAPVTLALAPGFLHLAVLDLTGDPYPEIALTSDGSMLMLVNDGTGAFTSEQYLLYEFGGGSRPTAVDLSGNGRDELVITAPAVAGYYVFRSCGAWN